MAEKPKHGGKRPGSGRPKSDSDNKAVKIHRLIADRAFIVAKHRGITLVDYLSDVLKKTVDKDYSKVVHELDKTEPQ